MQTMRDKKIRSEDDTNQCEQTEHLEEKCNANKPKAAEAEKEGRMTIRRQGL